MGIVNQTLSKYSNYFRIPLTDEIGFVVDERKIYSKIKPIVNN